MTTTESSSLSRVQTLSRVRTTTASIPTTTYASCSSNDGCDQDWLCVNATCRPCCDDTNKAISTAAVATTFPSATAKDESHHLDTAASIGVGVAIIVILVLGAGIGYWIWRMKRGRRPHAWEAPADHERFGPHSDTVCSRNSFVDEHKRFVETASREELSSPMKPIEIASVELMELEGDFGLWGPKTAASIRRLQRLPSSSTSIFEASSTHRSSVPPLPPIPLKQTLSRPKYRFEEYTMASEFKAEGQDRFLPVVKDVPVLYANAVSSTRVSSCVASKHSSLGDTVFLAGDGPGDEAFRLFRWPESSFVSSANSPRGSIRY